MADKSKRGSFTGTPSEFLWFVVALGFPALTLRDAVALALSAAALIELPRERVLEPRHATKALSRAAAPFVYGAATELFRAGFTPGPNPPRDPKEEREDLLQWVTHIREQLATWKAEIDPLLYAAEAGDLPNDPAVRRRVEAITKMQRILFRAPRNLQAELRRAISGVKRWSKGRGRELPSLNPAEETSLVISEVFLAVNEGEGRVFRIDKEGVVRWNVPFLADRANLAANKPLHDRLQKSSGKNVLDAHKDSDYSESHGRQAPEDLLDRLEMVDRIDRLDAQDRELLNNALSLGLDPEKWGGREHHRAEVERGYNHDRKTLRARMGQILARLSHPA